jgi:hypothetical protein
MRPISCLVVLFIGLFFTLTLDEKQEDTRSLASSWNIIPSRSLSGLYYLFKGHSYNEAEGLVHVTGPVIEITNGEKAGSKIYPEGFSLEMDQEDFEEEQLLAQSVFEARSGSGTEIGTAFLVGRNLLLTNRHLMNIAPAEKNWRCGEFSILLNHKEERVNCEKVRFCSSFYDFCVVQMQKMQNGQMLGDELRPLRLARTVRTGHDVPLLHIGNAAGLGLQASRGRGLRTLGGEFFHFTPTLGGSSGAPIFDEKKQVVGINWGHTGQGGIGDEASFSRGVLSSTIFNELKKTHPYTLSEIKSFRTWIRRETKPRQVKIENIADTRP